jgi:hypothetical protein
MFSCSRHLSQCSDGLRDLTSISGGRHKISVSVALFDCLSDPTHTKDNGGSLIRGKVAGAWSCHSPRFNAKVKNTRIQHIDALSTSGSWCPDTQTIFHAVCLMRQVCWVCCRNNQHLTEAWTSVSLFPVLLSFRPAALGQRMNPDCEKQRLMSRVWLVTKGVENRRQGNLEPSVGRTCSTGRLQK